MEKELKIVKVPVVKRVDITATLRNIPHGAMAEFKAKQLTYNFPSVKTLAAKLQANGEGLFHVSFAKGIYTITRE